MVAVKKYVIAAAGAVVLIGMLVVVNTREVTDSLVKETLPKIQKLAKEGRYRCCLAEPCLYCYARFGNRPQGEVCDCLDEVVAGELPCGECLGEIIEGEGNRYLKDYFPSVVERAVAEYKEG